MLSVIKFLNFKIVKNNTLIARRDSEMMYAEVQLKVQQGLNKTWSMDFMHEGLIDGRSYRLLNVLDDFNREGLGMEMYISLSAERVIRILDRIIEWRGKPKQTRCDNGPEYIISKLIAER